MFLNGIEVFRDQLPPGEVTNTTFATGSSPLRYNSIVLPTMKKEAGTWHSVFVKGSNVITVGLFGCDTSGFQSHFDASLRFTGEVSQFRGFDMTGEIEGLESHGNYQQKDVDAETNILNSAAAHSTASAVIDTDHETWISSFASIHLGVRLFLALHLRPTFMILFLDLPASLCMVAQTIHNHGNSSLLLPIFSGRGKPKPTSSGFIPPHHSTVSALTPSEE